MNFGLRLAIANGYVAVLIIAGLYVDRWVLLVLFLSMVFFGVFGMMVGSVGYRHWFPVGLMSFLGWIVLGGGLFLANVDRVIVAAIYLPISIPAINALALRWPSEPLLPLSKAERQGRLLALSAIATIFGFTFLLAGSFYIASLLLRGFPTGAGPVLTDEAFVALIVPSVGAAGLALAWFLYGRSGARAARTGKTLEPPRDEV